MFIIKFNNMIRNKWIWGFFAVIVASAFVFSDMSCGSSDRAEQNSAGRLDGEPVEFDEYTIVRQYLALNADRADPDKNPEREIWEQLAALKTAGRLGIVVGDEELVRLIHQDPSFHDAGRAFSPNLYNMQLNRLGLTGRRYEEMVRRQLILGRMEAVVASAGWVSPAILHERVRGLTDSFTLCTAVYSNTVDTAAIELSDEEIARFYARHGERYREPDRRQVVYAVFKAADYLDRIETDEDALLRLYDENIHLYTTFDPDGGEQVRPFEEVRAEIEDARAQEAARRLAYLDAADFSDVFFTNRTESLTFEAAAAAQGVSVLTSRLFTAKSSPVHIDGSPAFVQAAFALTPEPWANRFSDAVNGGGESYVIGFHSNVVSHIPPLEDVLPRVRAAARMEAADNAFRSEIDKLSEALVQGRAAGRAFRDVAAELGMVVSTNTVLSYFEASQPDVTVPSAREIATLMAGMNAGDVMTNPIATPGGALFFEVVDRESGDSMMYGAIRNQAMSMLYNEFAELIWEGWKSGNLSRMNPSVNLDPMDGPDEPVYDDDTY